MGKFRNLIQLLATMKKLGVKQCLQTKKIMIDFKAWSHSMRKSNCTFVEGSLFYRSHNICHCKVETTKL